MLNRRRVLTLATGALALGACGAAPAPAATPVATPVAAPGAGRREGHLVAASMDTVYSVARGRDVRLAVVTPTAPTRDPLPVCLVLHGRDASAKTMLELGLPSFLAGALRAGSSPFALVAVDGGSDSYWLRNGADDPQAMLREELPTWLPGYGLAAVPDAVAGISMGGFGALVYARARSDGNRSDGARSDGVQAGRAGRTDGIRADGNRSDGNRSDGNRSDGNRSDGNRSDGVQAGRAGRTDGIRADRADGSPAVAAISPALFRSWAEARTRKVFADESTWAAAEPLRHRSGAARLGVWCGQADRYLAAARQLASTERAAVARFGPGGHDVDYWRRAMPEALRFLRPPRT